VKTYQIVVVYAKHVGLLQGLLHALLLGVGFYFFILVTRTESATPVITDDHRVIYVLTEHGATFEWPLAAEKHTFRYHLIQGGLVLTSLSLFGLIIYNFSKLHIPGEFRLRPNGFEGGEKPGGENEAIASGRDANQKRK
jgi:hypothetical protein